MTVATDTCALRRDVLGHVGSKWSALVLTLLADEPRRYSEIRRSCRITPRMLSLTLRELERDGLVTRSSADYALTAAGRSLYSIIQSLISWSDRHQEHIFASRAHFQEAALTSAAAISDGRDSSAM